MRKKTYVSKVTVRGTNHVRNELPNQDSVFFQEILGDGKKSYIIMAVMDGVSSCVYAERASRFLAEHMKKVFEANIKGDSAEFTINTMQKFINRLYDCYMEFIKAERGVEDDFGTTAEIVVLDGDKAYTLHAGDGLILLLKQNGEVFVSEKDGHSGDNPGEVYPFYEKDRWEFNEYDGVVGAFVSSDGVYEELLPMPARRNHYLCDFSLAVPMMDIRAHKNKKEMRMYQLRYIKGELSDKEICEACCRMVKKDLVSGMNTEQIREHFLNNRPYRKFGHSGDDLSFVLWMNREKMPENYDFSRIPDYFSIWLKERG